MSDRHIKKIAVADLRLGMHLHALDGAWLDHPFWRRSFTLTEPADIDVLQGSGIAACWIDVEKGADVARADVAAPDIGRTAPFDLDVAYAAPAVASRVPIEAELQRAAALVARSRGAVRALFREARLGKAIDAEGCAALVEDISASVLRNSGALISLARLKTRHDYTYMHSVAVCALMIALGGEMGLDAEACRQAGLAGLLHDVGKAAMPVDVLDKPTRLDDREWRIIRTHPERGQAMLLEGRGAGPAALDVCLHHHERIDGTGYPHGLAGEAISLLARMGSVCDVYDAVTSNRAYKAGWDPADAIARMASWKGQFDPSIFALFVRSLGIYPVGSLVRLASGRLAVVAEHNPAAVLAPTVRVFFSTKANLRIPPQLLDLSSPGTTDRIVARESRTDWGFQDLDALWCASLPRR